MAQLRIFSYLPNPRIWKATIAGRLCGVEVEVRGASAADLGDWFWDFDARPKTMVDPAALAAGERVGRIGFTGSRLYKSDAFLAAHPFGTVPAAFSPDGRIGVFESNSIMRAVARLAVHDGGLYGRDAYAASRIDSFLDASLVFARDTQFYLLALGRSALTAEIQSRAAEAFAAYMAGIEQALAHDPFVAGEELSLADICFLAELGLLHNELVRQAPLEAIGARPLLLDFAAAYPRAADHFATLRVHPAFAPDVGPYLEKLAAKASNP
ncbi:MAG TPA: glutathione S-transferase family protein [Caulobacteraceae bacterium]|nr:glutathione S-transferase family protein [Caulobacteraceae bacterium]